MDTNGGSCTRQSQPGPYIDAQACASMQAAWNAAQSGDTVNIVDGTYGGQGLTAGTKTIIFRAAGPGRPSVGQLISAAANITVRGILIEDRNDFNGPCSDPDNAVLYPCGANQTYDDVIIDGRNTADKHGIRGAGAFFTLKNSDVRNILDQKGAEVAGNDMVFENNYWHDIRVVTNGVHNECAYVYGGNRQVWRRNYFSKCPVMALFFTNSNGGSAYRDVVVENNVFTHTLGNNGEWHASCAFKIGSGYNGQNTLNGWIYRYNTSEVDVCVDNLPGGGSSWVGNLGGIECVSAFTYRYNVGQTCGGVGDYPVSPAVNTRENPNQAPFYVNAPALDFHLRPGSAAIDRGDPLNFPPTDRDGWIRPVGPAPDSGAYEFH
jgi:hypothetical protein